MTSLPNNSPKLFSETSVRVNVYFKVDHFTIMTSNYDDHGKVKNPKCTRKRMASLFRPCIGNVRIYKLYMSCIDLCCLHVLV